MISRTLTLLAALTLLGTTPSIGQEMKMPKPGPEFDILQSEVGTWDVVIKTWAGPGEPTVSKGKETNRMLGGFWLLADFQGNMMGLDFQGHGMYSYDTEKKQYVGSWVDSMSRNKMEMIGKYNKETETMVYEGMAPGMDGKPTKHVLKTKYNENGTRRMTMHIGSGDSMTKFFEMNYTKSEK